MTKEEIVFGDMNIKPTKKGAITPFSKEGIYLMMDQYAEQVAIDFAEWKDEKYINYQMQNGRYYAKTDLLKHISLATVFTTKELYTIFNRIRNETREPF